jgi:hypothetical protein
MSRLSNFVNDSLLAVHHGRQSAASSIPAAARAFLAEALFPTFQLLLLPLSADLLRLYLTSPVLVDTSFDVFTDLFPRVSHSIGFYRRFWVLLPFCRLFWFLVPTLLGNPPGLAWCFFLDARMGGVSLSVILE